MGRTSRVWERKGRGYFTTLHKRQRYLGENLKEAKAKLKQLIAADKPQHHSDYTVRQLVDMFLAELADRLAQKDVSAYTYANLKSTLARWAEACRRIKPDDLRAYHLKAWCKAHPEWNQSSRSTAVRRVKAWAAWAKRDGHLDFNHLRDAQAGDQLKREAADPADLAKIEAAIDRDCFRDFYRVLYDTGCRPGELKTLTVSSVDWGLSTAVVVGKSGSRAIGLTSRSLEILRRCSLARPEGSLLRTTTGADWSPRAIHQQWSRACRLAGVKSVCPYHLRHDLHRRWSAAGISDLVIASQLGHTGIDLARLRLLASTYAHVQAEPLAAAARLSERQPQTKSSARR